MIYEKIALNVDVAKLQAHLHEIVFQYPPIMQALYFGGWSVLSSNGSYTDGWQQGHKCYEMVDGKAVFDVEKARQIGLKPGLEYHRPTEICTGYLAILMQDLGAAGLTPRRARISLLKAGGQSSWHRDAAEDTYAVRLHIPIITNELCTFECEEGAAHLPSDGSAYALRVNRMHQIYNRGLQDRFHLMMEIRDTQGVTRHHAYSKGAPDLW